MSGMDLYIFILCVVVLILVAGLFASMLYYVVKKTLQAIEHGLEDERITTEYYKELNKKHGGKIISTFFFGLLLIVLIAVFGFSVYVKVVDEEVHGDMAVPKVVMSDSMAFKHESNLYLEENNLNDQIDRFDLVFVRELPDEFELEVYDVVVYEYRNEMLIHRIVGIEEPNSRHPGQRQFLLQGDSIKYPDEFPVLYEQMKAIYEGEKIPYIGSFLAFMQSPAGYLCLMFIVISMVVTPVLERKILKAKTERLKVIGVIEEEDEEQLSLNV